MGRGSQRRAANPSQETGAPYRQPASTASPDVTACVIAAGANGRAASDRSGQDERRRGWFWHWNGIVTQYAPLIGLKGVGLLNSYTVWTDRREDSPHRGYAFPSQQSEANFYGEDRAELITINKILVALDLIEIRKEMVRKVDAQGRRWKVPQNFYRVKDRPNGIELTTEDVIRVIELADRDRAVYRYIRKVFSSRFEPIDSDNVWHQILVEIAEHPTWKKLAARAARQEAQASARSKAGHRSRARKQARAETATEPDSGQAATKGHPDAATPDAVLTSGHVIDEASGNTEQKRVSSASAATSVADAISGSDTVDAPGNKGSGVADEDSNNGSRGPERGNVGVTNNGHEGSVEPGNTTYYETSTTTTTTTSRTPGGDGQASDLIHLQGTRLDYPGDALALDGDGEHAAADRQAIRQPEATAIDAALHPRVAGPGGEPPQRRLADAGAGPVGDPSPLVVSLYEAANDRRATPLERILLSELEVDADAPARAAGLRGADWVAAALREAVGSGSAFVAPKRIREIINRWAATGSGPRRAELDIPGGDGENSHANTHAERDAGVLKQMLADMLGTDVRVTGGANAVVVTPVTGRPALGERRVAEIERQASEMIGRPVRLQLEAPGPGRDGEAMQAERVAAGVTISRRDAQQGEQLWNALLDMLAAEGAGTDLLRLRAVVPIGQREDGAFLLGAPTRLAARLLEGRFQRPVEQALSSLLEAPVHIAVLNPDRWAIID